MVPRTQCLVRFIMFACVLLSASRLAAAQAQAPSTTWTQALADAQTLASREWARRPAPPATLKSLTPGADPAPLITRALADIGSDDLAAAGDAETLLEYLGDDAFAPLAAALPAARGRTLQRLALLLGRRGERAVPPLSAAFRREPSPEWRSVLLIALGRTESPAAIPIFIQALQDAAAPVRSEAAAALGQYQSPQAFAALAARLPAEPDDPVCRAIAQALAAVDYPAAAPLLARRASDTRATSTSAAVGLEPLPAFFRQLAAAPPAEQPYHHPAPPDLALLQLARDAHTRLGERFPKSDLDRLLAQIPKSAQANTTQSRQLLSQVVESLAYLRSPEAVPLLLRSFASARPRQNDGLNDNRPVPEGRSLSAPPFKAGGAPGTFSESRRDDRSDSIDWNSKDLPFALLALFPTPEAVQTLANSAQSAVPAVREAAVEVMGGKDRRWLVPLLVALLDDPRLLTPAQKSDTPGIPGAPGTPDWPATHLAHGALYRSLGGRALNLLNPEGQTFDLAAEIAGIKAWWAKNRLDFLAGKPVPPPQITDLAMFLP